MYSCFYKDEMTKYAIFSLSDLWCLLVWFNALRSIGELHEWDWVLITVGGGCIDVSEKWLTGFTLVLTSHLFPLSSILLLQSLIILAWYNTLKRFNRIGGCHVMEEAKLEAGFTNDLKWKEFSQKLLVVFLLIIVACWRSAEEHTRVPCHQPFHWPPQSLQLMCQVNKNN